MEGLLVMNKEKEEEFYKPPNTEEMLGKVINAPVQILEDEGTRLLDNSGWWQGACGTFLKETGYGVKVFTSSIVVLIAFFFGASPIIYHHFIKDVPSDEEKLKFLTSVYSNTYINKQLDKLNNATVADKINIILLVAGEQDPQKKYTELAKALSNGQKPTLTEIDKVKYQYIFKTSGPGKLEKFEDAMGLILLLIGILSLTWRELTLRHYKDNFSILLCQRNEEALLWRNALSDVAKIFLNESCIHKTNTYRWLVDKYNIIKSSSGEYPLEIIKILAESEGCECNTEYRTYDIAKAYKSRRYRAANFLCVIFASRQSKFFQKTEFLDTLNYFAGFDRLEYPCHHITRIFSVPVSSWDNKNKKWPKKINGTTEVWTLDKEHRVILFCYLWINWACGIDTKLHIFNPNGEDIDFFQAADYVVCHEPTADFPETEGKVLYVAIPGNENLCYEITGNTLVHQYFSTEFFHRITEGAGARNSDVIVDFIRRRIDLILDLMSLDRSDLNHAKKLVSDWVVTLKSTTQSVDTAFKNYVIERLNEWN